MSACVWTHGLLVVLKYVGKLKGDQRICLGFLFVV